MGFLFRYCSLTILLAVGWGYLAQAQIIDDIEYFIDDGDLGVGLNPSIAISPGASITETFTIPTSTLSAGFHTIYFRTHEQISDLWSISESRSFYISASNLTTQADIVDIEYFIDNDPGIGAGTSLGAFSTTAVNFNSIIPTNSLSVGFHVLYTRTLDSDGVWGNMESRSFYITSSDLTGQANIIDVEYYIDSDPGYGAGTSLGPFASTTVDIMPVIPTNTLPVGFHTIYLRALDSDGVWGDLESRSFYISSSNTISQANIIALEYYIDNDPGYSAGLSIPITAANNLDVLDTLNTSGLAAGHHTLYVRALDDDGIWSEVESRSFFIDAFAATGIAGVEYFFDSDPGIGNSTTIPITPVQSNIDSTIAFATTALVSGPHVMGIRLVTENGLFGMTEYLNLTLCDGATAAIQADIICLGSPTSFIDNSTNVLAGDIYSWDFDNDGFEDSNTLGNQTFTYPSSGTYFAKLSIDRSGCIGVDSIQVIVETLPIASAGVDQTLCTTNTVLEADPLNANETGLWSVFSGSAVIVDPTDPISNVNSIANNTIELIWELNNTLGGCSAYDTIVINSNLPIVAMRQTNSVDIGQSSIVDIQSIATINPGDLLTTTITTDPFYGLATVLSDESVEYTPDLDAAVLDSVQYRITNQCSNFSENYIVYSIINAPPVVQEQLPTPQLGSTSVNIDLSAFITDSNNNVDLSSITIISQPISGASASIDASGVLSIDYTGITFSGNDRLEIQVCDLTGVCVIQAITIPNVEVGGENPPITVFNGVSPDGDGYNDFLEIENIEFYPDNTVFILNRWGSKIHEYKGYNNNDVVFSDASLPSGTYYYHILPNVEGVKNISGHFVLVVDN